MERSELGTRKNERGNSEFRAVWNATLDHSTDALVSLRSLHSQVRVQFKMAVLVYKTLHGSALTYLSQLFRVANLPGWRSLHCIGTSRLQVPSIRLSAVGDRSSENFMCILSAQVHVLLIGHLLLPDRDFGAVWSHTSVSRIWYRTVSLSNWKHI